MTEMWERFTFYGMRALLVLFLVSSVTTGGFDLDDKTALRSMDCTTRPSIWRRCPEAGSRTA